MIQRLSFVTTTWRVSHLVSVLAYAAYFCVRPVYSECRYSYSEQKLQPAKSSPTAYSVALTASSWTAINSPGMTYKTTVTFSSGYFIELIPAGCTLVKEGTVSCSQAGKAMLNLVFQKITAVGNSGGSYLLVAHDTAVVGGEEREGRVMRGVRGVRGVRKDYSTALGSAPGNKPPTTTPQPPPAVVSIQICGEFCTLSTPCPILTPNITATPTPPRSPNATTTSTSLSTKTTASPTPSGQMATLPPPVPGTEPNLNSNKSAVIIGSIFAVVVVAFAVGYALMRRNMALGASRGGKKKKKEADQEDIKYIRPLTPAPPTLPQLPASVAAPATAAMTTRQLDSASGGGGGGVDLESQSRFKKPSPPVVLDPESRQRQAPPQQPSNTTSTRTATNTATAAAGATSMLARGRSVREAAPTRNDRQQPPGTTLAGSGGNVGADMQYLQGRQRVLAMDANTSASAPALDEMSDRSLVSAPTYTLPELPPPIDPVNVSVPVSISTMASLPLPVSTRISNNSDWSAVDTADLEFLIIPVSNSSASARQKNGTPSPPLATRGAEKEEVMEDVDLDDGSYGEREEALLKKSKSMRYPWSSRRGADADDNGVAASSFAKTSATVTFADTSPLRRAASASVSGSGSSSGSKASNYNNNNGKNQSNNSYNNNNANTTSNYRSPYYQQPGGISGLSSSSVPQLSTLAEQQQRVGVAEGNYYPQQQQQQQQFQLQQHSQHQQHNQQQYRQQEQHQYQQKQQKMGWAQSQDDLLMRARSMPRTTIGATSTSTSSSTTAMNSGFPPRTMKTQQPGQGRQGQGQQQRADPRGLYGYL